MKSFFYLELDTTPPEIEIYGPPYTSRNKLTTFNVESNEPLSSYQNVYIIDSKNNRHNVLFQNNKNNLYGEVYLRDISVGNATLYVEVKDEVDNTSISSYSFIIHETEKIFNKLDIIIMKNKISLKTMKNKLAVKK